MYVCLYIYIDTDISIMVYIVYKHVCMRIEKRRFNSLIFLPTVYLKNFSCLQAFLLT